MLEPTSIESVRSAIAVRTVTPSRPHVSGSQAQLYPPFSAVLCVVDDRVDRRLCGYRQVDISVCHHQSQTQRCLLGVWEPGPEDYRLQLGIERGLNSNAA